MDKKIFIILLGGLFILGVAQAQTGHKHETTGVSNEVSTKEVVDVGNKICPVSGEKIDEKLKETYEYKGKIYNFCCPVCIEEFKKDPEKYIQKVEQELQAESKEQAEHKEHEMEMMQGPETMHQGMHEGHQHTH